MLLSALLFALLLQIQFPYCAWTSPACWRSDSARAYCKQSAMRLKSPWNHRSGLWRNIAARHCCVSQNPFQQQHLLSDDVFSGARAGHPRWDPPIANHSRQNNSWRIKRLPPYVCSRLRIVALGYRAVSAIDIHHFSRDVVSSMAARTRNWCSEFARGAVSSYSWDRRPPRLVPLSVSLAWQKFFEFFKPVTASCQHDSDSQSNQSRRGLRSHAPLM